RVRDLLLEHGARAAQVAIAAVNAPEQVVLSGPAEIVHELAAQLRTEGVDTTILRISIAAHSPLMEPMERAFDEIAQSVVHAAPHRMLVSNVTGEVMAARPMSPSYWVEHLRSPVRFADGIQALVATGADTLIEIGPHPVLVTMARTGLGDDPRVRLWLPSLQRDQRDTTVMLQSLAALYTHGAAVDWEGFDKPYSRSTVSLPTYPFQRARYWRAPANGGTSAGAGSAALDRLSKLDEPALADLLRGVEGLSRDELLLAPKMLRAFSIALEKLRTESQAPTPTSELLWRKSPRSSAPSPRAADGSWLLLVDQNGFGDAVAGALEALGGTCFRVRAGEADIERTWAEILAKAGALRGFVSFASLDVPDLSSPSDVDAWQRATLDLLAWTRLATSQESPPVMFWITSGAVSTGPGDIVRSPGQAALWGLGRSLSAEQPSAWGGLVDIEPEPSIVGDLVLALVDPDAEDLAALRPDGRYVQRLVHRDLPGSPAFKPRPDGTWIISGGLGALGMHVARWFARHGVARLILTSRRGEASPGALAAAGELRALGARVELPAVDVADMDRMAEVIASIDASGPPLAGVVHAAGVGVWSRLDALTADELRDSVRAKVTGALVLDALTRGRDLEAFVCFSSAASAWPSPTQGAYAAANAFLDAFAHRASAEGRRVHSLSWGPWSGGGMATEDRIAALENQGVRALTPERSLDLMSRAIAAGRPHTVVADVDWPRLQALLEARGRRPLLDELVASDAAAPVETSIARGDRGADLRERLQTSTEDPRSLLTTWLRGAVADVLGFDSPDRVPLRAGFFSLGMDSIMTVNLRDKVRRALDLRVPTSVAFNHPNVEALAAYLLEQLIAENVVRATAADVARDAAVAGSDRVELLRAGLDMPLDDQGDGALPEGEVSEETLNALLDEKLSELSEFLS
ncbi:MAG: SDR family NAD(P)-dependent oxidoreductase, partial [Polyangiaceae bacterium]|nr:SDR family NAD(P)-dependent oxidoreductase [Polyangiaceae bacterium]